MSPVVFAMKHSANSMIPTSSRMSEKGFTPAEADMRTRFMQLIS